MSKDKEKGLYTSPNVEVMEIMESQMICQSGGIKDMVRDSDQELDW